MYVAIIILCVLAFAAWNFLPQIRAKMRGFSTIIEGAIGTFLYVTEIGIEGVREIDASGYMPVEVAPWVPWLIGGWIFFKRFQTTTAVGGK